MYIDYDLAMDYLDNSEELFKLCAKSFIESYEDFIEICLHCVNTADMEEFYRQVHSLKGITLNLGMQLLYDVCNEVVIAYRKKELTTELLDSLLSTFDRTYLELKTFLN